MALSCMGDAVVLVGKSEDFAGEVVVRWEDGQEASVNPLNIKADGGANEVEQAFEAKGLHFDQVITEYSMAMRKLRAGQGVRART